MFILRFQNLNNFLDNIQPLIIFIKTIRFLKLNNFLDNIHALMIFIKTIKCINCLHRTHKKLQLKFCAQIRQNNAKTNKYIAALIIDLLASIFASKARPVQLVFAIPICTGILAAILVKIPE